MTRGTKVLLGAVAAIVVLGVAGTVMTMRYLGRADKTPTAELRRQVAALEEERGALRAKRDAMTVRDMRAEGMPQTRIRVMIPTTLAGRLVDKFVTGFADQITLELKNIRVKKSGTIKKVITLGQYDLKVLLNHVSGRIKTGKPTVEFGGNKIGLALPATIASGSGRATINFKWDGRNISGAVCGDMDIEQVVSGSVIPGTYQIEGAFSLLSKGSTVLLTPQIPPIVVNLKVDPSRESWAAVKKILDDKQGVCGFVLDRVDILGVVRKLIDKGFNVKLPTQKLRQVAMPVAIDPEIDVRGRRIALKVELGGLAITKHAIWVGANVAIAPWKK